MVRLFRVLVPSLALSLLAACGSAPPSPPSRAEMGGVFYGQVRSIEALEGNQAPPSGAGALIGGVAGAVIGRQFGDSGNGRAAGTMVGLAAGAIIGNEIERQRGVQPGRVRVSVSLDHGGIRAFEVPYQGEYRVGDRVRVAQGRIERL